MTGSESHDAGQRPWCPSWDGTDYAANTGHHRDQDAAFLADCPLSPTDRVLDLGCGSGDFTRVLADRVPAGAVLGVDPQASMLEQARARAGVNQRFDLGTAQALHAAAPDEPPFDLVVSRATLHWIPAADIPGVYRQVASRVRPGGWFRFECGGHGNIPASLALMDEVSSGLGGPTCPWNFAHANVTLDRLEQAGFDVRAGFVRLVAQRRTFDRDSLLGWMRSQVFMAYTSSMDDTTGAAFTAAVESRVDQLVRWDGTYDQTWVRLDARVQRPTAGR